MLLRIPLLQATSDISVFLLLFNSQPCRSLFYLIAEVNTSYFARAAERQTTVRVTLAACQTAKQSHDLCLPACQPASLFYTFPSYLTPQLYHSITTIHNPMASTSTRLFVCQKCNQQLGVDESLQDIHSTAFDLLLGTHCCLVLCCPSLPRGFFESNSD